MAFQDNTVFVIGAGASAEFGLPVGWQLLEQIRDNSAFEFEFNGLSRGNRKIFETVYRMYSIDSYALKKAFAALSNINQGVETAGSIDEYINRYSDDALIAEMGKIQIAYAILAAETRSAMMASEGERDLNWRALEETWIAPFTRSIFDGVRAVDVETIGQNITIICFNYDRCIEHYLEHAIRRAYHEIDQPTARRIVNSMNIIHPYGSLGPLDRFSYGTPVENVDLYHVTKNIITWSETNEDHDMIAAIKSAINQAKTLVFLGFAFANQNMKLLDAAERSTGGLYGPTVYATGKGLTEDIDDRLKDKIYRLSSTRSPVSLELLKNIRIKYGMVCKEFIDTQLMNFTD